MKLKLPLNRISEPPAIRTTAIAAAGTAIPVCTAASLSSGCTAAVKRGISGYAGCGAAEIMADNSRINLQIY